MNYASLFIQKAARNGLSSSLTPHSFGKQYYTEFRSMKDLGKRPALPFTSAGVFGNLIISISLYFMISKARLPNPWGTDV